jgi:hypothetical protein
MAGILDNKKRIMDTIVTQEGRRQLASGNFKIKYASFTDGNVFYEEDLLAGTTDATLRIPFEAVNKWQDNIVFETDDSGNLLNFQGDGIELNADGSIVSLTSTYPNDTRLYNGKIVIEIKGKNDDELDYFHYYDETTEKTVYWVHGYADDAPGADLAGKSGSSTPDPDAYGWFITDETYIWPTSLAGADKVDIQSTENFITSTISSRNVITSNTGFSSAVKSITEASFDSFNKQNFITTKSSLTDKKLSILPNSCVFTYTTSRFDEVTGTTVSSGLENEISVDKSLNASPAFINDTRLSNVLNFKFLPPVNNNDGSLNGLYADLNDSHDLTTSEISSMIEEKQSIECSITSSQRENNIIFQIFENDLTNSKIKKLDMIDAGKFNIEGSNKRIIFVGKVFIDSFDQPTFINMFTIEVSNDD